MLEGPDGSVYLTDLENSAIVRWDPASKSVEQIITDKVLWPDTLSWGRRDVRDHIADRKHAAVQRRHVHAQRAIQTLEDHRH